MLKHYVWEARMDDWDTWPGSELYDDLGFAKFCVEQDYKESFPDPKNPVFTWETVMKGLIHMYEDEVPTGISLRARKVNSKDD